MIKEDFRFDSFGKIVDFSSGDGGDTLNREGQYACLTGRWNTDCMKLMNGMLEPVRNRDQIPWNNPKNVTRDQLTPFVCAHYLAPTPGFAKEITYQYLKGRFFAPNIERDYPGSRKYPWPHVFINDRGVKEFRWFDYADILSSPLKYLITALDGRPHPFKFAIAWVSLLLSVVYLCGVTSRRNPDRADDWQMLCLCMVIEPRFIELYKKHHSKGFMYSIEKYWLGWRQERGFADLWAKKLSNQSIAGK